MPKLRVCFLVSGGGTTMAAILAAITSGALKDVEPALVIASKNGIGAIDKADKYGLKLRKNCYVVRPQAFEGEDEFGYYIINLCQQHRANFVGQYGWMPKTPLNVTEYFQGRMINQHPGPLDPQVPGYDFGGKGMYGLRVHAARLNFVRATRRHLWTEAVCQFVAPEFDRGEVVAFRRMKISVKETPESVAQRLLPLEYETQIDALEYFAKGQIRTIRRSAHWLVEPQEKELLEECKAQAIRDYPKG